MQETEFSFGDLLFSALRKWRKAIVFALVCAILAGGFVAVTRFVDMNDPEKKEIWQAEYDIAYGSYWAAVNDFDRQISENERLAAQAKLELDKLNIKKSEYEGNLEDLKAEIAFSEARIADYEKSIDSLKVERDRLDYYLKYCKEHNENSLLMDIDPYKVNVYDTYLRVDSGYTIDPSKTEQEVDPTVELLQTYRLLVSNTGFYNKMISDLGLETEVRYLTDVISITDYGTNSLYIRVISNSAEWANKVGEYIARTIENEYAEVSEKIANHELERYKTISYETIDNEVYSRQHAYTQEVIEYEAAIREVEATKLNTEANIRAINTDIRTFNQQIEEINLMIANLPVEIKALENEISASNDANFTLRAGKLELLKTPEPQYGGYTVSGIITGFIKLAIIGGIVGAALAFIYFALEAFFSGRVLSPKHICDAVESEYFGYWPQKGRKCFAVIDKLVDRMSGYSAKGVTPEVATDIVLSNIAVACAESKKVMICGGAAKEVIAELAKAAKAQLNGTEVIFGGTIGADPAVVHGMAECDAVIIAEQIDKSALSAAVQIKERADVMNKPVLGVIVHK